MFRTTLKPFSLFCSVALALAHFQALTATLYYGGDILTMEGDSPQYVESLLVDRGKIIFTGNRKDAEKLSDNSVTLIDLQGMTLVPGFIDGHSHFFGFGAQAVTANLLASPDGEVNDIPTMLKTLKSWYQENGTDKTQGWIVGMGFDDAVLKENRFPTRHDLDQVSENIPIMVVHISGHFSVVNSKGLAMLGIDANSENPSGGVIRREQDDKTPNGVLEELAAIPAMIKMISPATPEIANYYIEQAQKTAVSYGYTTAQEGRAMGNHEQLAAFAEAGKFYIDVNSYVDYSMPQYMNSKWFGRDYKNGYRIAGLKLTLDGSPQGRTAWRTKEYLLPPDGQE
ncbi:hypothetical protein E8M12_08315 [Thalassotalea mangrovi]|uniref:Amidohydrolase 3 domain-containing protein n=1 Tax=Thalassotalea mangrovi TaxID=2572245 RepID=A0A4U1B574_9GAMM|nr:hypothetical protein E8M12_08315 [Thalassotalea mangrovi]